ncbi:MAG TPA: hypothetical protein PLM09_09355 [Casimicrobiaceae bacterium]|nr:hypothetical protein [Casimicrobiaceae bacterium]
MPVPPTPSLGVTVMPEWFQCEGIGPVLDRIEALGARAIATSPYVLEPSSDGEGAREPPPDGEAGRVRPLDRPLFGRTELLVRTAPAFEHDVARYAGLRYRPSPPTALTRRNSDLLDRVVAEARARGIEVLLQVMAACPPGYRVQFSGVEVDDQCRRPDGTTHAARVDRNASLASPHVVAYTATLVAELAERYPGVAGFRLDWPEAPPYDFESALFDFHPAMQATMRNAGRDPGDVARGVIAWSEGLRRAARDAASQGLAAVRRALSDAGIEAFVSADGVYAPLREAKREAVLRLLRAVRRALDAVPGTRRRLEPQVFPPPFHRISGFPLDALEGLADRVGVKLYTMHWPMLARYWARDLLGAGPARNHDAVTAAIAGWFGLTDAPMVDGTGLRYPEPHESHPVGSLAQRRKLEVARAEAGRVPVVAFAHAYGPIGDVVHRVGLARSSGLPVWINRYGYLSDAKLAALARGRAGGSRGSVPLHEGSR